MPLFVALAHYPTTNKEGRVVATSVTNFDIHDIARSARTYGVARYYIVHPSPMQRDFVARIMRHWVEGSGAEYNPSRKEALEGLEVLPDLAAVGDAIERDFGAPAVWAATSARASGMTIPCSALRARIEAGENVCLIFGTGSGLHPEVVELADVVLDPIHGPTDYNHLSVRSAVSIYLDRLMAREPRV